MAKKEDLEAAMRTRPRAHVAQAAADIINAINTPHAGDRTVEVELSALTTSRYQVRSKADSAYIDELAESIRASGLISPVIVRQLESNCPFEVVAGHHRAEACRRLGLTKVQAIVRRMSDAEAALALTADNAVRKELTHYERFKHIEMLQSNGFCKTNAALANATGLSATNVQFYKAFAALPAPAKAILDDHPEVLGSTLAYQLQQSGYIDSQPALVVEAISRLAAGKLKQAAVLGWIADQIARPVKPEAIRRRIHRNGVEVQISVSGGVARIKAPGIDADKLQKLIADHIDTLFAKTP